MLYIVSNIARLGKALYSVSLAVWKRLTSRRGVWWETVAISSQFKRDSETFLAYSSLFGIIVAESLKNTMQSLSERSLFESGERSLW